jgi:hypothetical protein
MNSNHFSMLGPRRRSAWNSRRSSWRRSYDDDQNISKRSFLAATATSRYDFMEAAISFPFVGEADKFHVAPIGGVQADAEETGRPGDGAQEGTKFDTKF